MKGEKHEKGREKKSMRGENFPQFHIHSLYSIENSFS